MGVLARLVVDGIETQIGLDERHGDILTTSFISENIVTLFWWKAPEMFSGLCILNGSSIDMGVRT